MYKAETMCEHMLILVGALILCVAPGHSEWMIERVDFSRNFSDLTDRSMQLDENGHPCLVYGEDHLYYAYHDGSSWLRQTIDGASGVGKYPAIRLGTNGTMHVSYYDETAGDLKYAFSDGSTWHIDTVDHEGDIGEYTSLALDAAEYPHISYYDGTNGALKYARLDETGWTTETVDPEGYSGEWTSIAIDAADLVHIAYYEHEELYDGTLKYAKREVTGWEIQTLDADCGAGGYASLALTEAGIPCIGYCADLELNYAQLSNGTWEIAAICSGGDGVSLVLDAQGRPHMSHCGSDLLHTYHDGVEWHTVTVDTDVLSLDATSIDLSPEGYPSIGYWDPYYEVLKFAAYDDVFGWQIEIVEQDNELGMYSAVAVGAGGDVHISYHDAENTALRYAHRDQSGWAIQIVDAISIAGQYTSIVLDSYGFPHIGYAGNVWRYASYDGTVWNIDTIVGYARRYSSLALDKSGNPHLSSSGYYEADLFYAYHDGSLWHIDVLVEDYFAEYSSMAVDGSDHPHIAYLGLQGLMYASYDGINWQTESATGEFTYVKYPSLELADFYRPCIGYFDDTDGAVEYATKIGSVWTFETIDDQSQDVTDTWLALDPDGDPHICYHADGALKYAYHDGCSWHIETIDDDGTVGSYCSIAIDQEGCPHISYYDETNADLKYAFMTVAEDMQLLGEIVAGELVLTWSPVEGSIEYWVYGSAIAPHFIPGFAPGYANRLDQVGPDVFSWSSSNGIGSMDTNWTYLVLAVDDADQELTRSNRIGEHDEVMDLPW